MRTMHVALWASAGLLLTGCSSMESVGQSAPQPARTIDVSRLYNGVWHEIGRRPMSFTDGCVAGATEYFKRADGQIGVRDTCRMGTPEGELKAIEGTGQIVDPGVNAKLRVDYRLYGFVPVQRDYWVLDRSSDYSWFISADPSFRDLYIFTRNPGIGPAERTRLINRARALGYDVSKLEFPPQPKR